MGLEWGWLGNDGPNAAFFTSTLRTLDVVRKISPVPWGKPVENVKTKRLSQVSR